MKKSAKGLLITGAILVFVGILLFTVAMSMLNWDFALLSTEKTISKTHNVKNSFSSISIDVDTADVIVLPSEDYSCRVETDETENISFSVNVQYDLLIIDEIDTREWFDYIGINASSQKIYVYLPQDDYSSLSVETDTGDVCVEKLTFDSVDISTDTGDVSFADCEIGKLILETDTGDVSFNSYSGGEMIIETNTGDVTGTLSGDKIFIVTTSTGSVDVPATVTGEKCKITTDTGDVKLKIK